VRSRTSEVEKLEPECDPPAPEEERTSEECSIKKLSLDYIILHTHYHQKKEKKKKKKEKKN
jgi:hypothetical protein